jgi:hypothetical protein
MPQNANQRRASDAVARWLAERNRNIAWLAEAAKADPGTIGDFLAGARWPKISTQGRIEKALGWPSGTIRQIGYGEDGPLGILGLGVGGATQDASYVASPGERVTGGAPENEVLSEVRAMREEQRRMSERLARVEERLADS